MLSLEAEIRRFAPCGWSADQVIARSMGISKSTVRKALREARAPRYERVPFPTRLVPLRTRQLDRDVEQGLRPLGRDLWRQHRRRRDDRPTHPPRRGHRPQGRLLPPEEPRTRPCPRAVTEENQ